MNKPSIRPKAKQEFMIHLELTETQARCLHDITGYGWDAFIAVFEEKLGKHYIGKNKHEGKSLFELIYQELPKSFYKIDEARKIFNNTNTDF